MRVPTLLSRLDTSALLQPSKSAPLRSTNWADGLRGVASLGVFASHLSLAFWRRIIPPCAGGADGPSELFQRPIFRLVAQGQAWVAVFFILMGFVNPLKALKQAHYDDVEGALMTLAKSALGRLSRLVLPAAAVTVIAWLFCQLGFFDLARQSSAYWLQVNSPEPSDTWYDAIWSLADELVRTWVGGENKYDQPQWALHHLFHGSMSIYLFLLVTITTTPRFRIYALLVIYAYSWLTSNVLIGINVTAGILLSELHSSGFQPVESQFMRILAAAGAGLGLWLMSFPSEYQDWKPWTRQLFVLGWYIFPEASDMSRFWCGVGGQLLCFSTFFSPDLRTFFSAPILTWLGSISFSLYLLHGTLMRSLLAWMAFGLQREDGSESEDGQIPMPGTLTLCLVLPTFCAITLAISTLWTYKVEPYFGRATAKLQEWAVRGRSGQRSPVLPSVKQKVERAASDGGVKYQD